MHKIEQKLNTGQKDEQNGQKWEKMDKIGH